MSAANAAASIPAWADEAWQLETEDAQLLNPQWYFSSHCMTRGALFGLMYMSFTAIHVIWDDNRHHLTWRYMSVELLETAFAVGVSLVLGAVAFLAFMHHLSDLLGWSTQAIPADSELGQVTAI